MAIVELHREAGVAVVTINRPEKRNAMTPEVQLAMIDLLQEAEADDAISAVVITGAGDDFCVGGDFAVVEAMIASDAERERLAGIHAQIADCVLGLAKPAIAAVNGPALGFGAELAAFCDMVVMSENAFLCDPHVRLGLPPAPGALLIWPQLTSRAIAAELMLTGREVPAEEALRLGLANRVVAKGQALVAAIALGQELCALPAEGVRAVRRALRRNFARLLAAQSG